MIKKTRPIKKRPIRKTGILKIYADMFYKEGQIAKFLHLNIQTIRNWRSAGKGPCYHKLGGAVRYKGSDVLEFVANSKC